MDTKKLTHAQTEDAHAGQTSRNRQAMTCGVAQMPRGGQTTPTKPGKHGVYCAARQDGSPLWRASITYHTKHISLGSYEDEDAARAAYELADSLLRGDTGYQLHEYESRGTALKFAKWVALINLRDTGMYCSGPIYLKNRYFEYYLDADTVLLFDASELFYYTHHAIQRRGGHLFVADYGSQVNILNRYGVRSFAVQGRDYVFKNGDMHDFRSGNIVIINRYNGVRREEGTPGAGGTFTVRIHVRGDLTVGHYDDETDAAIAYNKAADMLEAAGVRSNFNRNYLEHLTATEYKIRYERIKVGRGISDLVTHL